MSTAQVSHSTNVRFFLPFAKIDKATRMVSGYASTPTLDLQGERISLEAITKALPDYMQWANIREMHQASAVGVAKEANVDPQGLFVSSKVVDEDAWQKCLEGVYKGYSIGGERISKVGDTITELKLLEISLVDRPANPDCRIEVSKAAGVVSTASTTQETEVITRADLGVFRRLMKFFGKAGDGVSSPAWPGFDPLGDEQAFNHRPLNSGGDRGGETSIGPTDVKPPGRSQAPVKSDIPADDDPETDDEKADRISRRREARASAGKSVGASLAKQCDAVWAPNSTLHQFACLYDLLRSLYNSLRYQAESENGDKGDARRAKQVFDMAQALGGLLAEHANEQVEEEDKREDVRRALVAAGITEESLNMAKTIFGNDTDASALVKRMGAAMKSSMGKAAMHVGKAMECCAKAAGHFGKASQHADAINGMVKGVDGKSLAQHAEGLLANLSEGMTLMGEMSDHHELASFHMGKVTSTWTGESEQSPGEGEGGGIYEPTTGGNMGGRTQADMTEGGGYQYDPTRPVKAMMASMQKQFDALQATMNEQLKKATEEAAFQRGRAETLAAMPAGAPRAAVFRAVDAGSAITRGAGAGADANSPQAIEMAGVDLNPIRAAGDLWTRGEGIPADLADSAVRNAARLHGNRLAATISGRHSFGKSLFADGFQGGARVGGEAA